MNDKELSSLFISSDQSIRAAMQCIDRGSCGIALVVDSEGKLQGTITDGDVRRAILSGTDLESPVSFILSKKISSPYPKPVTASEETEASVLVELMQENLLRQIPILDKEGRVKDLVMIDDLMPNKDLSIQAIIMAGGMGTRLRPLTEDIPKPMLPVGGKPLIELLVKQLCQSGIRRVNIATHYKSEVILNHFGDGRAFGVDLNYVNEDKPLGTAGALGLMGVPREPLLVINGDILTQVDFRSMLAYHQEHRSDMTVGVKQYEIKVPYGVVECEGSRVSALKEKPQTQFLVNAGIYLLEPRVYDFIPNGEHFNMTDLIQRLIDSNLMVISFPIIEYWLDIGQHSNYEKAQNDLGQSFIHIFEY